MSAEIVRGAVTWTGKAAIDADGDPDAYRPDGKGHDAMGNAGKPGNWFGVETDTGKPDGKPILNDQGGYDTPTSLRDHDKPRTDQSSFVDAFTVPYVSVPRELWKHPVQLGDFAMVIYGGVEVGAIVADVGPAGKYGEVSEALARMLGFKNCSPRNGGVDSGVTYVIFPGSACSPAWPLSPEVIQAKSRGLYDVWKV